QIVASLRERNRPVEYLRFEDEGHGLVKLRNRVVAYPRIADFLDRHLAAPDAERRDLAVPTGATA
ncbi:MAG TPA: prolyl oligopeptidase family serine peptidase, partial [Herpetosiphonaceae bacterium]|nr:prolyl oligopeptidase family serine peptidase [Herpetosiphonaceae bacterium]